MTTGIRYANAGTICIASSTGVTARWNRSERPARTPSGIPIASESATAENMSAKVSTLSCQRPMSANDRNAASTPSAARRLPKRSATDGAEHRRPHPRQLVEEVGQPRDEVVEEGGDGVEDREEEARIRRVALRTEPVLEIVEIAGQRAPGQPRRPRELVAPAEVGDEDREQDRDDEAVAAAPPRARRREHDPGRREVGRRRHASSARPQSRSARRHDRPRRRRGPLRPRRPGGRSRRSAERRRERSCRRQASGRRRSRPLPAAA